MSELLLFSPFYCPHIYEVMHCCIYVQITTLPRNSLEWKIFYVEMKNERFLTSYIGKVYSGKYISRTRSKFKHWKMEKSDILKYCTYLFSQIDLPQQTLDLKFLSSLPTVSLNIHFKIKYILVSWVGECKLPLENLASKIDTEFSLNFNHLWNVNSVEGRDNLLFIIQTPMLHIMCGT